MQITPEFAKRFNGLVSGGVGGGDPLGFTDLITCHWWNPCTDEEESFAYVEIIPPYLTQESLEEFVRYAEISLRVIEPIITISTLSNPERVEELASILKPLAASLVAQAKYLFSPQLKPWDVASHYDWLPRLVSSIVMNPIVCLDREYEHRTAIEEHQAWLVIQIMEVIMDLIDLSKVQVTERQPA